MNDHATLLALALALDAIFGEPKAIWSRVPHPAVLMGRAVAWSDTRLNSGTARRVKGIVTVVLLGAVAVTLGLAISAIPGGPVLEVVLVAVLLAQKSLVDHVHAVVDGLGISLDDGRRAVSMIVGRDTSTLDKAAVSRAAIESAAENLSDGVIAPTFWFLVAGLPGILFYKIINTADSMIGHKTQRHAEFGWASARLDDVLNWIPARLTAMLIGLVRFDARALRVAARDGPLHRSVNAGWPEAAMASTLGLALSGPRSYGGTVTTDPILNVDGRRAATTGDIALAVDVLWRVWVVVFLTIALLAVI